MFEQIESIYLWFIGMFCLLHICFRFFLPHYTAVLLCFFLVVFVCLHMSMSLFCLLLSSLLFLCHCILLHCVYAFLFSFLPPLPHDCDALL